MNDHYFFFASHTAHGEVIKKPIFRAALSVLSYEIVKSPMAARQVDRIVRRYHLRSGDEFHTQFGFSMNSPQDIFRQIDFWAFV
jgi:hypothetical protein